jgi:hypothetical protein
VADDAEQPQEETLELAYDLFKDVLNRQMQAVVALDAKAVQTIAAATVAAGVSALGGQADLCPALMVTALVVYLGVLCASVWALWPRSWALLHGAQSIWDTVWSYTPSEFRHSLIARVCEDAAFNHRLIRSKARAVRVGLITAALEVAVVVVAVVEAAVR